MNRKKLAVIPSDPLNAYSHKADLYLEHYFNPGQMFEEVFVFSPLEKKRCRMAGMSVVPTEVKHFRKQLTSYKIDMIRAYGGYWACDLACKKRVYDIPVVVSVHDTNPDNLYSSIKKADVVFCTSEAVKKLVLTKFDNEDRVWILPNRVDFSVMRPMSEDSYRDLNDTYRHEFKILHVGRKSREKNLDTLIKALAVLGNDYCVIAIGKGDAKEWIKLAEEQEVRERCYFIESIDNEDLARYYSWADCMCVPSRWEGFGIVFIEALACQSVVVTSDIAPMNDYIKHMKNGLLVKEYEDPGALANMLEEACKNKKLIEDIKKQSRHSVEKFEMSKIESLEKSYYEKVLDAHKKGLFKRKTIWNFLKLN